MLVIGEADVRRSVSMREAIPVIADAFAQLHTRKAKVSTNQFLFFPNPPLPPFVKNVEEKLQTSFPSFAHCCKVPLRIRMGVEEEQGASLFMPAHIPTSQALGLKIGN
ncbi:hypothetical protein HMI54_011486 [Coelomomyces lativittatus]|nr:hypothetical protein HMI54_011486 [Coelomomyces lativittatus]